MTAELGAAAGPETFPRRQTCLSCWGPLGAEGAPVFELLYCSLRCAGRRDISLKPRKAPRQCLSYKGGRWEFKVRYRCPEEVPLRLQRRLMSVLYMCDHCWQVHVGRQMSVPLGQVLTRAVDTSQDLADLLVELRGGRLRERVSVASEVGLEAIEELEDMVPGQRVDVDVLLRLLNAYGVRLGAALPETPSPISGFEPVPHGEGRRLHGTRPHDAQGGVSGYDGVRHNTRIRGETP